MDDLMDSIRRLAKHGMLWYAILLHWTWGATLLSSSAPLNITAIATVVKLGIVSANAAAALYMLAAVMAICGMFITRTERIFFVIPQVMLLWVGAIGAIIAMYTGQFADGVIRSTAFLVADQAPAIIAAVCYTLAIYLDMIPQRTEV